MRILKWILTNGTILAMFLGGMTYGNEGILQLSIAIYWLLALATMLFFSDKICNEVLKGVDENKGQRRMPSWVSFPYSIAIVGMLAYYNYPVLAFVYLLAIVASENFKKKQREHGNQGEPND